jgi:biopolymer transport protein ExbB
MKFLSIAAAGFALSASVASAAEAQTISTQIDFLEVLAKGGPMMYPLGVLSIVTVLLIFVFSLSIRRNSIVSDRFMNSADLMIRKRDYLGLVSFSHRHNECMARIVQKTLDFIASNPGMPFENVREVTQTEGSRQASILTSRITYLSEIGAIAPMIGLLGTVIGMIKAFIEISTGGKQGVREMGLAEGVSEALIATAAGLAISILAFVFYSVFRSRVQKYICELEAAATHLVALLHAEFVRESPPSFSAPTPWTREDFAPPIVSPLAGDRPDVRGL